MKGPSLPEVATAKLREAQRLVRLQRSYDAECVASDAKVRWVGKVWLFGFVLFWWLGGFLWCFLNPFVVDIILLCFAKTIA